MLPLQSKNDLQTFLVILNYLSKFSPATVEVCKPLWKLTSPKAGSAWNGMYQDLYDRAMKIIKKDACMKLYHTSRTLQLQTDASSVYLGPGLLHIRDGMNCGCEKIPDNATLHPLPFGSMSFKCWAALKQYRMRSTQKTTWSREVSQLLFC